MAENINRCIAIDNDDSKVARSHTDKPPAHFTLKVDSFSLLYQILVTYARANSYESEVFEAGGYKWRLSLYPNGDKANNAEGYISLSLEIVDPQDLPQDWEVTANLKFFVYDHFKKKYLTIQDGNATPSRFDAKKTGFGIARVLPLCSFKYAGNGYLVNDKCIFGAEVLVQNYVGTGCTIESLALVKAPYTWKIEKFSSLSEQSYLSDVFTIGNRNWKLKLYPKGDLRAKSSTLSVYLVAQDFEHFPERKTFAKCELRTVNECRGKDMQMRKIAKSLRDVPPAHYTLQINSFSELDTLLSEAGVQNYESEVFEASGYKWKLSMYPNGDKQRHGEGYISLYLVIEETGDLPPGWEVNVNFKFFVYDQIRDKYLTIQDLDGKVRRFHQTRTEWGFAKLIPLGTFKDAANGYLISDKCVFGAEIFVIKSSGRGQAVSVLKELNNIYTWKIDKFSSLDQKCHESQVFALGDHKWKMLLFPKGDPCKKDSQVELYLQIVQSLGTAKVFAKCVLRVRDQKNGTHMERTVLRGFSSAQNNWGYNSFLSFADLHDTSNGFLVKDTLIIEAEIITISTVKDMSK